MHTLSGKLVKIEHYLTVFDNDNNQLYEVLVPETMKLLRLILTLGKEYELYDGVKLSKKQVNVITSLLPNPVKVKLKEEQYYLCTTGVYNW